MKTLRINSYFAMETNLAGEMRSWTEFVSGNGYDVDLRDASTGEDVTVRFVERKEDAIVQITGTGAGPLFDRVAGRVVFAMSANSDSLLIDRHAPMPTTAPL